MACITPGSANVADDTDCPPPVQIPVGPALSIDDVSFAEGDSGSANMVFTVTLSEDASAEFTVDYRVDDGTATTRRSSA